MTRKISISKCNKLLQSLLTNYGYFIVRLSNTWLKTTSREGFESCHCQRNIFDWTIGEPESRRSLRVDSLTSPTHSSDRFSHWVSASRIFRVVPIWVQKSLTSRFFWVLAKSQTSTSGAPTSFENSFNARKYSASLFLQLLCRTSQVAWSYWNLRRNSRNHELQIQHIIINKLICTTRRRWCLPGNSSLSHVRPWPRRIRMVHSEDFVLFSVICKHEILDLHVWWCRLFLHCTNVWECQPVLSLNASWVSLTMR